MAIEMAEMAEKSMVFIGNQYAIAALRDYAKAVSKGEKRRPVMLVGPPGTGKSLAAHIVAGENRWNVVELNASDYRDQESIDGLLGAASQTKTIFGARNVLLLDEIDELAPRFDRGASSSISNLIKVSKNPMIFIANDRWNQSITFLREAVDHIEFPKLAVQDIAAILADHVSRNGIVVSKEMVDLVANRANGDARCAINDITVLDGAQPEAVDIVGLRDKKIDIFKTLDKIFFSNTYSAPMTAVTQSDVENDMLLAWLDENLPKRYKDSKDLDRAYRMLSDATMYFNNATRKQYYTYWRYMNVLMSSGIALSKDNYPDRAVRYTFPRRISELSKSKEARGKGKEIAEKLRRRIHTDMARIMKMEMPLIARMAKLAEKEGGEGGKERAYEFFEAKFGLDKKEMDWLSEKM